jgi:calcineurin-like phosphoesterase family protein
MVTENRELVLLLLLVASVTNNSAALGTAEASTNSSIRKNDFNIVAAGDWACNPNSIDSIRNTIDKDPELVLALGDFSYEATANCWLNIVDPIDHKMKIVIGNHDDETSSLLNQYMNHFNLTKQFYSFNYQNIHFTAMSVEVPFGQGSEQYDFVDRDLASAYANPDIDWIIVFLHEHVYNSLYRTFGGINQKFVDVYHPLFDKYKVDLVVYGDVHNYQRSYPLKYNPLRHYDVLNSTNPVTTAPIKMTNEKNNYSNPIGQIYVTVGTAGAPLQKSLVNQAPYIAAQQATAHGILDIVISNNGNTLLARFHSNDGTVYDQFSIDKHPTD